MSPRTQSFLTSIGALVAVAVIALAILLRANGPAPTPDSPAATSTLQTAAAIGPETTAPPSAPSATSTPVIPPKPKPRAKAPILPPAPSMEVPSGSEVARIQNPYSFAPEPFSLVNERARAALVNIVCTPRSGSLRPISGSGVIIDARGVILTNAHVAQYVLLSQSQKVDLRCVIRSGSPAVALWSVETLYVPPVWVRAHAADIIASTPTGTGEHDYALLRITGTLDGTPAPAALPALAPDTREAIGFLDDPVLAASYPAEFIGGIAAQFGLYSASSVTSIQDLLTFGTNTVDIISLGGIIEAQSGSSGGSVVNAWGRLIGIITTTSEGTTTAARDLHAITLSYIDRDLTVQTQHDLGAILGGDIAAEAFDFNTHAAPALAQLLVDQLTKTVR